MPCRSDWKPRLRDATACVAVASALLSGCASPDGLTVHAVPTAVEQLAAQQTLSGVALSPAAWPSEDWWVAYGDRQLDRLMQEALSGVVSKRSVQLGQKIAPGVALMAVVPLDHLWVDANFKESQLRGIRIGQPVRLSTDLYGRHVVYRGTVIGQEAGTGSAFSLLPAQNATGNWIKVTQRVPVRIALDAEQVAQHPLQLGLSMRVTVDTHEQGAARLVTTGSVGHGLHTEVETTPLPKADALVRSVIAANR